MQKPQPQNIKNKNRHRHLGENLSEIAHLFKPREKQTMSVKTMSTPPTSSDWIQLKETDKWINSHMKQIEYLRNVRVRITVTYELTSDVWIARATFGNSGGGDLSIVDSDGNTLSQALAGLEKDLWSDDFARVVRDLEDAAGSFDGSYDPDNQ